MNKRITKRIPTYDIAKGMLIIFVAWGHSDNNIAANGFDINKYEAIHDACFATVFSIILPFYMPAFFFISGCCSNFEKGAKDFVLSRIKSMLLPMFIFCYLPYLCVYTLKGSAKLLPMLQEMLSGGKWFIAALFVSELFFYCINRYVTRNCLKQLVICTLMYLTGSMIHCSGIIDPRHDFWALNHVLMLTFMLPLGILLKDKIGKISLLISFVCFIATCFITQYATGGLPFITNYIDLNYASILPLFVLAASGSVFIVSLCHLIGHMPALEFLGKHTLLIFFLHGHFYLYKFILPIIEGASYMVTLLTWLLSILSATFIPALISRALDIRYLRLLKGKTQLVLLLVTLSASMASAQSHPIYYGDINNDGTVTVTDIVCLQRQILGQQEWMKVRYDSLDISSLSPNDTIYITSKDNKVIKIAAVDIKSFCIGADRHNPPQDPDGQGDGDNDTYTLNYVTSYTHGARRSYEGMAIDGDNLYAVGSFGLRKLDYRQTETPQLVKQLQLSENTDLIGRCIAQNEDYLYIGMRQNSPGTTYKHMPQMSFDFEDEIDTTFQLSNGAHIVCELASLRCPNKGQTCLRLTSTAPQDSEEATTYARSLPTVLKAGEISFWLNFDSHSDSKAEIPILWHGSRKTAGIDIVGDGTSYSISLDMNGNVSQGGNHRLRYGEWYNIKVQITDDEAKLSYRTKEAGYWELLSTQSQEDPNEFDAVGFGLSTEDKNVTVLLDDFYFNETDIDAVSYVNGALVVVDKATMSICNKYNLDVKGTDVKVYGNILIMDCLYGCNVYKLDDKKNPLLTYTYRHPTYKEFQGIDLYHVDNRTYAFLCNYNLGYTILDVTNPDDVNIVKMDESWITHNGMSMRYGYYNFDVVLDYPYVYMTHLRTLDKQGTETDYRGIQVLDISDLNNVKRTLYTAPLADLCIKPYGDKCPVRIERLHNSLYIDNGDKGLLRFDMKGNGVLEYKGPFKIPGCQSAFNMLNDGNRRFFIGEDCYQNLPASIHLYNVK